MTDLVAGKDVRHCCICAGYCHHVGPPQYCQRHDPDRAWKTGNFCPNCGTRLWSHRCLTTTS
jgi:hypothetical protein